MRFLAKSRKFFSRENLNTDVKKAFRNNSDYIVKSVGSVGILSSIADTIADNARESLKQFDTAVKDSLYSDNNKRDKNEQEISVSESDLDVFRKSFANAVTSKIPENLENDIRRLIESAAMNAVSNSTVKSSMANRPKITTNVNKAVPDLDNARLSLDSRGIIDKFTVKLTISLTNKEIKENGVKALRILRSRNTEGDFIRKGLSLSRHGMDFVSSNPLRTRNKNFATYANFFQKILDAKEVGNSLSKTTKIDEFTGIRSGLTSASSSFQRLSENEVSKNSDDTVIIQLSSFLKLRDSFSLDKSVVDDLKSIRNIQLQNPQFAASIAENGMHGSGIVNDDALKRLKQAQISEIRKSVNAQSQFNVEKGNSLSFKELAIIPISRLKKNSVGNITEFYYFDPSVELGVSYSYYVTSIDNRSIESLRSKIASVSIENSIPPEKPKRLYTSYNGRDITLSILAEDSSTEKFEIYRKNVSDGYRKESKEIDVINGSNGFITDKETRESLRNGFLQVGEAINLHSSGGSFIDKRVKGGKKYLYRVYSVDHYGNKSQKPKEVIVYAIRGGKSIPDITKPAITAEIDENTKHVKITVENGDSRIVSIMIARKNLSLNEKTFTNPHQQSHIRSARIKPYSSKTSDDIVMRGRGTGWTGHFFNSDKLVFVDDTTRIDNVYQYCAYGIDRYGNKTSYAISQPLFVSTRPVISSPINLVAEIDPLGIVRISWEDGNLDIDPEDRIGNRENLKNTFYRTLFQVERKKKNEEVWKQFPLVDTTFIEDKVSIIGEVAPQYRPQYLEADSEYMYRVAAFQTGGFISNFSDPIRVNTFTQVRQPENFKIKTCDVKRDPFFVALNWDTPNESGAVSKWIIERTHVNNFAAAKINVTNLKDFKKLNFEVIAEVSRESSRARSRSYDESDILLKDVSVQNVLTGQRYFIDRDIKFGNTYFYKLTAVGIDENSKSDPLVRGIRITEQSFERKLNSMITQSERNKLSSELKPLELRFKFIRTHGN